MTLSANSVRWNRGGSLVVDGVTLEKAHAIARTRNGDPVEAWPDLSGRGHDARAVRWRGLEQLLQPRHTDLLLLTRLGRCRRRRRRLNVPPVSS